jgi:DNA-directed RNA polymerase subunit beta'
MGSMECLIISEKSGKVAFENLIEGVTYKEESDEQTGFREKVIIETRDKTKNPAYRFLTMKGEVLRVYNLPVGAHVSVE